MLLYQLVYLFLLLNATNHRFELLREIVLGNVLLRLCTLCSQARHNFLRSQGWFHAQFGMKNRVAPFVLRQCTHCIALRRQCLYQIAVGRFLPRDKGQLTASRDGQLCPVTLLGMAAL